MGDRLALELGYYVLTCHGPGQGASLRRYGHPFRPDWEVAVARALDFAERHPLFDSDCFILMGLSSGGHLARRAVSHEPRLRALIAIPGGTHGVPSPHAYIDEGGNQQLGHARLFDRGSEIAS